MSLRERLDEFISRVEKHEFLDVIRDFYADDATVQENLGASRVGLPAILEHETNVLASMKFERARAVSSVVEGDRAVIHWIFDIRAPGGGKIQLDEVAYQEWRDGKVVRERYYYDPAQMVPK